MLCLIAEADAISGGSGWVGAGMLGLILSWLLYKHIPSITQAHLDDVKKLSADFKEALQVVTKHCESQMAAMAANWQRDVDRIIVALDKAKCPMGTAMRVPPFHPEDQDGIVK